MKFKDNEGIDLFYSKEDEAWIARLKVNHAMSAFGDTPEEAVKELCVALRIAYEVLSEEVDALKESQCK